MRVAGRIDSGSRLGLNPFDKQPAGPVQVVVVDDHALVGRLVVALLERAGYTAAHVFEDTVPATWAAIEARRPEVVLLDFDLGPTHSAAEVLARATAAGLVVAGFTASDDRLEHAAFLEMGAAVVIPKGCGPADLVAVVELAVAGEELMGSGERHAALARLRKHREAQRRARSGFDLLTAREEETLLQIAAGHGAAEIAEIWEVSLPTVRSHIRAVLTKLGVTSQLQAAALARDSGWYDATVGATASSILTMPNVGSEGTIRRTGSTR